MDSVSSDTQDNKYFLSWGEVREKVKHLAELIRIIFPGMTGLSISVYGIPRGGIYVAAMLQEYNILTIMNPDKPDVFVDDIIDSGATKKAYEESCPGTPFFALYDKNEYPNKWLVFPWEQMINETGPTENIRRIIEYIGEDTEREGLIETPDRVVKSWDILYGGYKVDPKKVLKTFKDDSSDEIVLLKDIEFYSTCEHHMLPFFGKAHIAYIPKNKVIGISKLARVLEIFSRRLQIQERLCQQITELLDQELLPLGSACILEAQHFCMTSRGVQKQNSIMTTSSLTGVFREKDATRSELFQMIR